ncbi:MAG TPA: metallophosphoesterase [Blastocatellia bacterium]|nr:metallophosphoesterase [Blastocatellia bacterium]
MTKFLLLVSATSSIFIVRIIASAIFVAVQWAVLRAFLRILRSMGLTERREKLAVTTALALFAFINLPLIWFIVETFISPRSVLLYSPPGYEKIVRPFAYLFFVWMLGSFFFVAAAPVVMMGYATVQFFKRRRAASEESDSMAAVDLSRRRFLQVMLLAAASMPFALSVYGAVAARSRKVVERVIVPIAGLPPSLDGFTIVQMSDIHAGFFMKEAAMREYVEIANALEPDIVALTGDFVATDQSQVEPFMRAMTGLKPKRGVFGCLGNHDMFTGSEAELERQFRAAGFKLLRSANELIDVDGAPLNIIGVDYIGNGERDRALDRALRGIPLTGTTLLLLHAPYAFPQVATKGIHLTLSGHTHGGQIALTLGDMILTPARLSTVFLAGLYKIGESHLYVNRGLGTTGPPIRIGAPPEITHLTLKAI